MYKIEVNYVTNREDPIDVTLPGVGFSQEEISLQPSILKLAEKCLSILGEYLLSSSSYPPTTVRVVGHSLGAAVGAYVSMILDGSLNLSHHYNGKVFGVKNNSDSVNIVLNMTSRFHNNVSCICLGPPPCVSRSIIPSFVTSVLCGDDCVVRSSKDSWSNMVT